MKKYLILLACILGFSAQAQSAPPSSTPTKHAPDLNAAVQPWYGKITSHVQRCQRNIPIV